MYQLPQQIVSLAVTATACLPILTGPALADQIPENMETAPVYLEPGWSDTDRQDYYNLTQGSQLLPYH